MKRKRPQYLAPNPDRLNRWSIWIQNQLFLWRWIDRKLMTNLSLQMGSFLWNPFCCDHWFSIMVSFQGDYQWFWYVTVSFVLFVGCHGLQRTRREVMIGHCWVFILGHSKYTYHTKRSPQQEMSRTVRLYLVPILYITVSFKDIAWKVSGLEFQFIIQCKCLILWNNQDRIDWNFVHRVVPTVSANGCIYSQTRREFTLTVHTVLIFFLFLWCECM